MGALLFFKFCMGVWFAVCLCTTGVLVPMVAEGVRLLRLELQKVLHYHTGDGA